MKTIANYLYALAISGIYKKNDWQKWADNQISKNDIVEEWIYNVSLARSIDDLLKALKGKILEEEYYNKNKDSSSSDAIIGYYYLDYLKGNITLYELLSKSGSESDRSGKASLECEVFYSILCKIEKDESLKMDKDFLKQISILFEPFKIISELQKKELEEY